MGDIYKIITSGVSTIVLIDGYFHSTPAVWQREIIAALEEGIRVIGASSLGALRAAELHDFGMVGYGTVFEWYRDGVIDADDEVALLHGSGDYGYRPLSEPLVNIRYTLLKAVEDGCVTSQLAEQLIAYAKRLYYPDRSYRRLLDSPIIRSLSPKQAAEVSKYLLTRGLNIKKLDAIGALQYCAQSEPRRRESYLSPACLPGIVRHDYQQLLFSGFFGSRRTVSGQHLLQKLRNDDARLAAMRAPLAKRRFILEWAGQNAVSCPEHVVQVGIRQWEEEHGIVSSRSWLRANGLTPGKYHALLAERIMVDWLIVEGPGYVGLDWDFAEACRHELQAMRQAQDFPPSEVSWSINLASRIGHAQSLRGALADSTLLTSGEEKDIAREVSPTTNRPKTHSPEHPNDARTLLARLWIELSQRRLIAEWAKQNGVSRPNDDADRRVGEGADDAGHSHPSPALLRAVKHESERALVEWAVEQGPQYFGLKWKLEAALLRELQIAGKAARMAENL